MGLTTGEVVVTTGSQQLLSLLSDILLDPGDIVITEAPTYFVYQGVLQGNGARDAVRADGRTRTWTPTPWKICCVVWNAPAN